MQKQFGRTARNRVPRFGGSGEIVQSVVGVGNKKRNAFLERGEHCVRGLAWIFDGVRIGEHTLIFTVSTNLPWRPGHVLQADSGLLPVPQDRVLGIRLHNRRVQRYASRNPSPLLPYGD